MKPLLKQSFSVQYKYDVYFTRGLFNVDNPTFASAIEKQAAGPAKILFIVDDRVASSNPNLCKNIKKYAKAHNEVMTLVEDPIEVSGSEAIKNDRKFIKTIYQHINDKGICRHSYVVAIGGGALLDAVGFVAATAHRGIRLLRVPTTILGQGDSGVGVKNGINYFGKKNYLGTFAPPYAVLNDFDFMTSLEFRDWLAGLAESIKVSLIKDGEFFNYIQSHVEDIKQRNEKVMQEIICRSAELHLLHIGTQGDPFELGSSRPLDFGHWSAHKLEQTTNHRLRHGEAVAIGVALDSTYSYLTGLLPRKDWLQIIKTLKNLGYELYVPEMSMRTDDPEHVDSIFKGLTEFREHLGGELTIMMLEKLGKGKEIHSVNFNTFNDAIKIMKKVSTSNSDELEETMNAA